MIFFFGVLILCQQLELGGYVLQMRQNQINHLEYCVCVRVSERASVFACAWHCSRSLDHGKSMSTLAGANFSKINELITDIFEVS